MKLVRIALIAFTITASAKTASARILTVNADGTAQYTTIQDAVTAALNGDEIIVEPGVYTGADNVVVDMLGKTVVLRSSSGPKNTIIDGEYARVGIRCAATGNAAIQGFTIRNGVGEITQDNQGNSASFGGGMEIINASPTILDCIFSSNFAIYGGGLHCFTSIFGTTSSPTLQNCTFEENLAYMGGGMRLSNSNLDLIDCTFSNNTSRVNGGGIHSLRSVTTCTDCVFSQNRAVLGGAWLNYESNPEFQGCVFRNNVATADSNELRNGESPGGAIYSFTNVGIEDSSPTITQSVFCENQPDAIWPEDSWFDLGENEFEEVCELDGPDDATDPFLRGDSNGDSSLDLSDAISILRFLFLGANPASCQAAADSNGDGGIDITDAIYSLNFLFLGGDALPAPTQCGTSELESDITLGCENSGCG